MSSKTKYEHEGEYLTITELTSKIYERAAQFPDEHLKQSFLNRFEELYQIKLANESKVDNQEIKHAHTRHIMREIVAPIVGGIGLVFILYLIIRYPNLTTLQSGVIWAALCLFAAAFAAMISGLLTVKYAGVRAAGSFGVAIIMYFSVPAVMNVDKTKIDKLNLFVANKDSISLQTIPIDFDRTSESKICDYTRNGLKKYYGNGIEKDTFTYYKLSDGKIYSDESCREITEYQLMVISNSVMVLYQNKREAYLHFFNKVK